MRLLADLWKDSKLLSKLFVTPIVGDLVVDVWYRRIVKGHPISGVPI
jgi:hypothetical protein